MPKAVFLVGFMGSGKTTVGRLLARRLGWTFADVDDLIEEAAGMPIPKIFEERGEPYFRRLESEAIVAALAQIEPAAGAVLSLGGGAFASEANRALLSGKGLSVWLDIPLEKALERVSGFSHRPLARDPERFRALYQSRRAVYALADHHVLVASDDPEVTVEQILSLRVADWQR